MKTIMLAMLLSVTAPAAYAGGERIVLHKSPTCGCCSGWAAHMSRAGFEVETRDISPDMLNDLKARLGVEPDFASCHTAVVAGYVIEGHVPAADVARLLVERPKAIGLAVPGMPIGSPGMKFDNEREAYDVLLITSDGSKVFSRYD